ncbi:MAG: ribonuclease HII [Candidatus Limnocylindrales bacterium]
MGVFNPTRRLENQLQREHGYRVILGLDEVGVAPSCGPVVACALAMPLDKRFISGVRDSKMLSATQRERLARSIVRQALTIGIGAASVREIDQLNIYYATILAMKRAVTRAGAHDYVIVDGRNIRGFEEHAGPYRAVIDGDARIYAISCASIIAKVTRDRLMHKLAARYPGYGWEHNAGYATPDHRAGMAALGVTPHHRRSFITTQRVLAGEQTSFDLLDELPPQVLPELVSISA